MSEDELAMWAGSEPSGSQSGGGGVSDALQPQRKRRLCLSSGMNQDVCAFGVQALDKDND